MNYSIIPATHSDLEFVLSLNQRSLNAVSGLDLKKINRFLKVSSYFKIFLIENTPVGFLIGLLPGKDYQSENYIWLNNRYESFIYVDRVIIDPEYRSQGLGSLFYEDLLTSFRNKVGSILCEVNIKPFNKQSINFHKKYGFKIIGKQDTENGTKRVSYMMYEISR